MTTCMWHFSFFLCFNSYISLSFCLSVPALSCPFPPLYRKKWRKKTKGINLEKEKKERKKAYSLPSLRGLGITCTGGTRCAEPSFQLRSAIPVTGVLAVGRVVENRFCTRGPNLRLDYWGGNIQIPVPLQANEPSQLPAKTGFKFNFKKPYPTGRLGTGGARKLTLCIFGSKFTNSFRSAVLVAPPAS